jgi:membrane protein
MKALHVKKIWMLLKDSAIAWDDDNIGQQGAALSFFTVFSLPPLLMIVIVLSSFAFGQEAANGQLVSQIRELIGIEGASFVQTLITNAYNSDSNWVHQQCSYNCAIRLILSGAFSKNRSALF